MPTFFYEALRKGGERVRGEIEAQSRNEAYDKLVRDYLQPLNVSQKAAPGGNAGAANQSKSGGADASPTAGKTYSLSSRQILTFTEELSDLLEAGLRLEPALRVMESRQEASALKKVAGALRAYVREGVVFSAALRRVSHSFSDLYCNLVSAGEQSGALDKILKRQLTYLQLVAELQSKVTGALVYPAFIATAGVALLFIFVTYLVPQLSVLLGKSGQSMPFATRMLVDSSEFMGKWWWAVIGSVVGIFFLWRGWVKTPAGRMSWDRFILRVPLIGTVLAARFYAQFAQTLATLTSNGIALHNSLKLASAATPNVHLQKLLAQATDDVAEGAQLSRALMRTKGFPPLLIDMVIIGEQTGDLPMALEKIGARYDKDLNKAVSALTALIQPAVIVVMAVVVGLVAYSMMGGIFQAVSGLRSRS
jgi:type II secretory pathway component PulF